VPETALPAIALPAIDLDLISFLKAIPDARMWRGIRIPAWSLLLVAVLGILSRCQSLRDLERFAIRHHSVLIEALGIELRSPAFADEQIAAIAATQELGCQPTSEVIVKQTRSRRVGGSSPVVQAKP
jgi:hypothetical protein